LGRFRVLLESKGVAILGNREALSSEPERVV
jgi:hypothetical protein